MGLDLLAKLELNKLVLLIKYLVTNFILVSSTLRPPNYGLHLTSMLGQAGKSS